MPKPSKANATAPSGQTDDVFKIIRYADINKRDYFAEWFRELQDDKAIVAIGGRISRIIAGNFGDVRPLRDGVWELRVDVGPGYRVYYAKDGLTVVLLLCGGDKRSQNRDIDRACGFWREWRERKKQKQTAEGEK